MLLVFTIVFVFYKILMDTKFLLRQKPEVGDYHQMISKQHVKITCLSPKKLFNWRMSSDTILITTARFPRSFVI